MAQWSLVKPRVGVPRGLLSFRFDFMCHTELLRGREQQGQRCDVLSERSRTGRSRRSVIIVKGSRGARECRQRTVQLRSHSLLEGKV